VLPTFFGGSTLQVPPDVRQVDPFVVGLTERLFSGAFRGGGGPPKGRSLETSAADAAASERPYKAIAATTAIGRCRLIGCIHQRRRANSDPAVYQIALSHAMMAEAGHPLS
jgi:hypothetical protein